MEKNKDSSKMKRILKNVTVEPVLFFYMLIIFLESNTLQKLISVKSCLKIVDPVNITVCNDAKQLNLTYLIEQEKTYWIRFNGAFLFLFTFLSSFFVASWSDKFGRKFPMLIPPLGTIIAASVNFVLSFFLHSSSAYLSISSTISGLTFGTVGIIASTFGFITDISDESARTKKMVILEAMIYIGGTLGIYIAGVFINYIDLNSDINGFAASFIFEICVAAIIVFYIIVRIPNRCNDDDDEPPKMSCCTLFKLDHVKDSVKAVFRRREAGKRKVVLLLLLALFFIYFGLVVQFTLAFYFLEDVLHWKFYQYSTFNSVQFAVQGLTLLLGMPVFFHFLKVPDHLIAVLGILSKMIAFIVFGLSNSDSLVYGCIGLYMFSEYPVPAIRSMLSKIVDSDEKGRIFAFTTMLQNFCFFIGTLTFASVYKATVDTFPGLCFEIVASLQAIAVLIMLYLYFTRGEVVTTYEIMENEDGSIEENCDYVRN